MIWLIVSYKGFIHFMKVKDNVKFNADSNYSCTDMEMDVVLNDTVLCNVIQRIL